MVLLGVLQKREKGSILADESLSHVTENERSGDRLLNVNEATNQRRRNHSFLYFN